MNNILIAKQFTPIYDEREDRIRLIFNINYPTRYDMWITRNFLIKLIYSLDEYIIEEKETSNINSTNTSNSTENKIYLPTNSQIKLLESFQITPINNNYLIRFSDTEQTIETTLTKEELSKLLKALVKIIQNVWGIMI